MVEVFELLLKGMGKNCKKNLRDILSQRARWAQRIVWTMWDVVWKNGARCKVQGARCRRKPYAV